MPLIYIFVVLLLVGLNAFFVATEFSLVAIRPSRIQQLKQAGLGAAAAVEHLLVYLYRILLRVQLGIIMSSVDLG